MSTPRRNGTAPKQRFRLSPATIFKYLAPYNAITFNRIPRGDYYSYKSGTTRMYLSPNTLLKLVKTRPHPNYPLNATKENLRNLLQTSTRMANRPNFPLFMDPFIPNRVVTTKNVALKRKRGL